MTMKLTDKIYTAKSTEIPATFLPNSIIITTDTVETIVFGSDGKPVTNAKLSDLPPESIRVLRIPLNTSEINNGKILLEAVDANEYIVPLRMWFRLEPGGTTFDSAAMTVYWDNPGQTVAFTGGALIINGASPILAELTNAVPAEQRVSGGSSATKGQNLSWWMDAGVGAGNGSGEIILHYMIERVNL